MDDRQIVEVIGKLTGVVTALEMQVQALLLAAVEAGLEPETVQRVLDSMPEPNVPSLGRDAYAQAMAGFQRRLEQVALPREDDPPETGKPMLERLMETMRRR
jgi:hypothetical protein